MGTVGGGESGDGQRRRAEALRRSAVVRTCAVWTARSHSRRVDRIMESVRSNPKRVVFAEGEEEKAVRAAVAFRTWGTARQC